MNSKANEPNISNEQDEVSTESSPNTVISGVRLPVSRYALFFLLLMLGAGADLVTKHYVFQHYYQFEFGADNSPIWWINGILGIQTSTNAGALFGFGQGFSKLFATLSVLVLVGIITWLFVFKGAVDRWLTFAFGLISGGIIGNFYDRVGWGYNPAHPAYIKNHVRDWIHFNLDGIPIFNPWPNFNIADALLVTGAIMLFLHAFLFSAKTDA